MHRLPHLNANFCSRLKFSPSHRERKETKQKHKTAGHLHSRNETETSFPLRSASIERESNPYWLWERRCRRPPPPATTPPKTDFSVRKKKPALTTPQMTCDEKAAPLGELNSIATAKESESFTSSSCGVASHLS